MVLEPEGNTRGPGAGGAGDAPSQERRSLLAAGSTAIMAGGMIGGYGTFFAMAGRYLYSSAADRTWLFVADANGIAPGESIPFESPSGIRVTITRKAESATSTESTDVQAESFLALSSVCPHLGCRVHWEQQNNRYFCPCHNGVFDPDGNPVSGPPKAGGQRLPRYALQIVDGALYIEMPTQSVGQQS
ncbi:MAG: ubiquinol-cytochrome c reductase iron-sulfur subunit [Pirellulaceae bacterium]|nr:ubiquinol-cytochrome c reductase iron-sulfur subunit [Planctomycetales bacterium]